MMPTMVAMRAGINHVVQELQEISQVTQFESQQFRQKKKDLSLTSSQLVLFNVETSDQNCDN